MAKKDNSTQVDEKVTDTVAVDQEQTTVDREEQQQLEATTENSSEQPEVSATGQEELLKELPTENPIEQPKEQSDEQQPEVIDNEKEAQNLMREHNLKAIFRDSKNGHWFTHEEYAKDNCGNNYEPYKIKD